MIERVEWKALPAGLRAAVEARTGGVIAAEVVAQGLSCTVALTLITRLDGALFLKGVREDDGDGVAALRREERVNPVVSGISPPLRHSFRAAGWRCLAFRYVHGRNAHLGPGSGDLDAVQAHQWQEAADLSAYRNAQERRLEAPGEDEAAACGLGTALTGLGLPLRPQPRPTDRPARHAHRPRTEARTPT
ncbi:hypothetical protein [Streptomyces sp. AK02-01A]|uniref:hypothetical protein n=1 Tax=Streptomyces sp. AK02-01A TaxID=3028648 RepID=UPI0029A3DD9F|nr:hypothetical protein [Streptomyces sp. AK02-01A]MDX3855426.1 hypothetical protein [Streptomyces sp. AK02-01A]